MTEPSETVNLIQAAQAGDRSSMELLFAQHRPRLLERIRLMMGEQARRVAESADFAQHVMIDAAEALPRFEPRERGSFLRWLTQIARNRIRDAVRRRREESVESFVLGHADDTNGPRTRAEVAELRENLADALLELGPDHRAAIEMRFFEHLGFAAIGQRLGRSENAAQLLCTRALMELGTHLESRGGSSR